MLVTKRLGCNACSKGTSSRPMLAPLPARSRSVAAAAHTSQAPQVLPRRNQARPVNILQGTSRLLYLQVDSTREDGLGRRQLMQAALLLTLASATAPTALAADPIETVRYMADQCVDYGAARPACSSPCGDTPGSRALCMAYCVRRPPGLQACIVLLLVLLLYLLLLLMLLYFTLVCAGRCLWRGPPATPGGGWCSSCAQPGTKSRQACG